MEANDAINQLENDGNNDSRKNSGEVIGERFVLEGTPKGHLVPLPAVHRDSHSSSSAQSPVQPDLGCLQGRGTTASLGNLCHCLTALSAKPSSLSPGSIFSLLA